MGNQKENTVFKPTDTVEGIPIEGIPVDREEEDKHATSVDNEKSS